MKVGQLIELNIEKMNYGGQGIGRYEGIVVFVSRTSPGDLIRARITKVKRNYAVGEILEILKPSSRRAEPVCPHYEVCGGCQLQHISYEEQLNIKTQNVKELLGRIGGNYEVEVKPIIGAEARFFYRNKGIFHCQSGPDLAKVGLIGRGGREVVPVSKCYIMSELGNNVLRVVREWLGAIFSGRPWPVKLIMVRADTAGEDAMAVLVADEPSADDVEFLKAGAAHVSALVGKEVSLWLSFERRSLNANLGTRFLHLAGKERIREKIGEARYELSPESFLQVNTEQAHKLYQVVERYAEPMSDEVALDIYSGSGGIALHLAARLKEVYAIEIERSATLDAMHSAAINGIGNCHFLSGKAEKIMRKLFIKGLKPQLAALDPPRAGCSKAIIELLAKMMVSKLVYVSCNPATLARDLAYMDQFGYRALEVQPLDMFPQTYHIECVARIAKNG